MHFLHLNHIQITNKPVVCTAYIEHQTLLKNRVILCFLIMSYFNIFNAQIPRYSGIKENSNYATGNSIYSFKIKISMYIHLLA